MKDKSFLYYIDNLRGISIAMVLMSHVWGVHNFELFGKIYYYLLGDATAWFVFISGYMFGFNSINKFEYKSYLLKKVQNVGVPYIIFVSFAIFIGLLFSRNELIGLTAFKYVIWSYVVGGSVVGPLWFIPMIFIYFLLAKLFLWMAKRKIFILYVIFLLVISMMTVRPFHNTNPLLSFVHYSGFYVLGLYVSRIEIEKYAKLLIIIFFAVIYFVNYYIYSGFSMSKMFLTSIFEFNVLQFGRLVSLIGFMLCLIRYVNHNVAVLTFLAKYSFGIFFVHGIFVAMFSLVSRIVIVENDYIYLFIEIVVVVVVPVIVISPLKKILGRWSKNVIGC